MRIVDAQIHIWSKGMPMAMHRQVASWDAAAALRDMDETGVSGAVLHPPGWDPDSVEVSVAAAIAHPARFCILGHMDPTAPDRERIVADWKTRPGMLGLRFAMVRPGQENWLVDGTLDWLWPAAERAGVPVALLVPGRLPVVGAIAARHPALKLIVDHCGARRGGVVDAEAFAEIAELEALGRLPNVALKATGAPSYSSGGYPYRPIHDYLHRMFDAFGPDRMFWGTDITRMPCSWRQCVTLFTEELPWLKGRDLERVMGGAVADWLGWKAGA